MTQENVFVSVREAYRTSDSAQGDSPIQSSGNVFADRCVENADELYTRGKIGIHVLRLLKQRNLKQRKISELLGIPQPQVSHLIKGEFQHFSEGKLLIFLKRLDTEIFRRAK